MALALLLLLWGADYDALIERLRADDPRAAFAQLLVEIRERYILRYEPEGVAAPGWHAIKVRVKGHRGDVRTRAGYVHP